MGFSVTNEKKIVIIGCGASGGTAAQFARKTNRKASITIFEKGNYSQYSKCGLPYVVSGDISTFDELIEFSEEWFTKNNIDLFLGATVEAIDSQKRMIIARIGTKQIKKEYDSLIIATGASASIPPIQNISKKGKLLEGVFTLRTIKDGGNIISRFKKGNNVTIVGAGLIGLEMVDSLYKKGMNITLVEALPHILPNNLDEDMCEPILEEMKGKITIYIHHLVIKTEEKDGVIKKVIIKDRKTNKEEKISSDMVIIAAGTQPETTLAEQIGCNIGKTKGIVVDENSETSVKNVYAVGDCTEYKDIVTKDPCLVGLGSIGVRQGIAAGTTTAGGKYSLPEGFLFTRTSEIFGVEIAAVGPVKDNLQKIPVIYGKIKGSSLPNYFPGGKPIMMKVGIHEETGVILSAQAIGPNASQRINTMACAIQNNVTVDDFKKMETAYAPPIAPTLDVLTLVCDVASLKRIRKRR